MQRNKDDRNNDTNDNWGENIYIFKGERIHDDEKQKIEHVRIDESVSILPDKSFYECYNLRTVEFPNNCDNLIKKIGKDSFLECYNLLSINLRNTRIESIGDDAFYQCENLATVQFPSTVRQIGIGCFASCHRLKVVDLSHAKHLASIEECAFGSCYALKTVNLPSRILQIGRESFYWCGALEAIDLRATRINEIGEGAFKGCTSLTTVHFPQTISCVEKDSFCKCERISSLNLQATNIERTGDLAFANCINLEKINFPKTITYIGKESFRNCTNLKYLNLQETSIEKIGDLAFCGCSNLTTVVGISTTDDETFHYDTHTKLPASLVEVGKDAFYDCAKLDNTIDNNWVHYVCDLNRGGRRFLQRDHHDHENGDDDGGDAKRHGKVYYSSLWPLILYRVMNEMESPTHTICPNDDNLSLYTNAKSLQRRASVVFNLLIHGVIADLQPQARSENAQATQTQAAASTTSFFLA